MSSRRRIILEQLNLIKKKKYGYGSDPIKRIFERIISYYGDCGKLSDKKHLEMHVNGTLSCAIKFSGWDNNPYFRAKTIQVQFGSNHFNISYPNLGKRGKVYPGIKIEKHHYLNNNWVTENIIMSDKFLYESPNLIYNNLIEYLNGEKEKYCNPSLHEGLNLQRKLPLSITDKRNFIVDIFDMLIGYEKFDTQGDESEWYITDDSDSTYFVARLEDPYDFYVCYAAWTSLTNAIQVGVYRYTHGVEDIAEFSPENLVFNFIIPIPTYSNPDVKQVVANQIVKRLDDDIPRLVILDEGLNLQVKPKYRNFVKELFQYIKINGLTGVDWAEPPDLYDSEEHPSERINDFLALNGLEGGETYNVNLEWTAHDSSIIGISLTSFNIDDEDGTDKIENQTEIRLTSNPDLENYHDTISKIVSEWLYVK